MNIDLKTRNIKEQHTSLNLVRIGTSGALQEDIPVDSFICSEYGLGLDGLLNFYKLENSPSEQSLIEAFRIHYPNKGIFPESYLAQSAESLFNLLSPETISGITASCSGFYGPQGRVLRLELGRPEIIEKLTSFKHNQKRITNFEMETGAMYGLAKLLGHRCCSINVIVANRISQKYSQKAETSMKELIKLVLDRLAKI